MSLDLLLIHPNSRARNYGPLSDLAAVETPVWAAMLATYARGKGHSVAILDAEAEDLDAQKVAERVCFDHKPLLACIVVYGHHPSASTQVMPAAGEIVRAIWRTANARGDVGRARVRTLLLGGHVAALPERTLIEESACDLVCSSEGPVALHRVLNHLKGSPDGHVHGITDPAPNVEDLDALIPLPAYDLLPMGNARAPGKYRAHNWHCLGGLDRAPYASLYTTLGCPYVCHFCCIQAPFKPGERLKQVGPQAPANSYRRWSPARVGETLEHLVREYGIRNIKIADEMFVLNRAHVEGICDEILRRKLDLNLWAYARTDTVRDGMAEKLRAAGFRWLAFGIESGDANVRADSDKALGRGNGNDEIRETLERVRAAGIHVIGNYIFGLPGETAATMQATLDLATELNTEFANFYCAMAYPGSPLYAATLAARPGDLPRAWSAYSQLALDATPLRTETLSSHEILAFRDRAFRSYHSSERYRAMIRETFGEAGIHEVAQMLAAPALARATPGP